jgi:hypothetical protein
MHFLRGVNRFENKAEWRPRRTRVRARASTVLPHVELRERRFTEAVETSLWTHSMPWTLRLATPLCAAPTQNASTEPATRRAPSGCSPHPRACPSCHAVHAHVVPFQNPCTGRLRRFPLCQHAIDAATAAKLSLLLQTTAALPLLHLLHDLGKLPLPLFAPHCAALSRGSSVGGPLGHLIAAGHHRCSSRPSRRLHHLLPPLSWCMCP